MNLFPYIILNVNKHNHSFLNYFSYTISNPLTYYRYDPQCLEGFRRADIYSLGLVFWEVCRRCISNGVALDYAAPYSEWLVSGNQEPTLEEMRKLVVADQRRPPIPNRWHSDPVSQLVPSNCNNRFFDKLLFMRRNCSHNK